MTGPSPAKRPSPRVYFWRTVFVRIEQDKKYRPVEPFFSSTAFPANHAQGKAFLPDAKYHVFAHKIASLHLEGYSKYGIYLALCESPLLLSAVASCRVFAEKILGQNAHCVPLSLHRDFAIACTCEASRARLTSSFQNTRP